MDKKFNLPIICSNVIDKQSNNDLFNTNKIIKIGDNKIGFFSLQNKSNYTYIDKNILERIEIKDYLESAKEEIEKLKKENVNYIVCLSHLGIDEDINLIKLVNGIDILFSGHSVCKDKKPIQVGNTILIQNDSDAKYVGVMTLIFLDGKLKHNYYKSLPLDENYPEDAYIMHEYSAYNRQEYPAYLKN